MIGLLSRRNALRMKNIYVRFGRALLSNQRVPHYPTPQTDTGASGQRRPRCTVILRQTRQTSGRRQIKLLRRGIRGNIANADLNALLKVDAVGLS